jgi:hypothetical protein
MWSDIALTLASSIGEAICAKIMSQKKSSKVYSKLRTTIQELFIDFADTSLDTDEFASLISRSSFIELLRNYYFSLKDGNTSEEYICKFEAYIKKECPKAIPIEIRRFITRLDQSYRNFLQNVIESNSELNAMFQLLTASHREIFKKISESENNLVKFFNSLDKTQIEISNEDIISYHNVCGKEFGTIRFTGIAGVENKKGQDINEFYVENTFSYYNKKLLEICQYENGELENVRLENFFEYENKVVLIGAAGLGKSTTLNYLFCNYEAIYAAKALKIKIDLKEYAKDIYEDKKDILWCLSTDFSKRVKRGNLNFNDIERLLGKYLDEGKCLVIFDALDEIPTQSVRNKVRDEIAMFSELYFTNRYIISTREVGYLKNRFDDSFLHIKINNFDDVQIKKYGGNWFSVNNNKACFDEFWKKFDIEVEKSNCRGLIRNPIILILALVIFDIEKNLPNKRVEFYKKCIETFLIVREDRKAAFHMSEKFKNILGDDLVVPKIAHYMFDHITEDLGYKFTYNELHHSILEAIEVPDKINWIDPVNQYENYLVDRTELIEEVDDDILKFAHKTFYEYFLAVYFSRMLETSELINLLFEWIGDANYDELARLIIEVVIEKNEPRQHKEVINYLFAQIENECKKANFAKAIDFFIVITELYKNNMLQPKFHEQYYTCLIYHSNFVKDLALRAHRRAKTHTINVGYDSEILAQIFVKTQKKDIGEFNKIIDSMFYLNNEFNRYVIETARDDCFVHISLLFTWVNQSILASKRRQKSERLKKELNYFLNEKLDLTISCPQLYISFIDAMVVLENYDEIAKILEFQFEPCNVFYSYTRPDILYQLLSKAFESWEFFLLLLICLIQCEKGKTNSLFKFVFDEENHANSPNQRKNRKTFENARLIWELLNNNESYGNFKVAIIGMGVYAEKLDKYYKNLYFDYQARERLEDDLSRSIQLRIDM